MQAIETGIYTKLTADATLMALITGVYQGTAPESATHPFVIVSQQTGVDQPTLGLASAWQQHVYLVKAVTLGQGGDDTTSVPAETIMARVDTLLNDGTITLSAGTLMGCRRTSRQKYPELVAGAVAWHVGSTYQIEVST